jgi:hypothetical protein
MRRAVWSRWLPRAGRAGRHGTWLPRLRHRGTYCLERVKPATPGSLPAAPACKSAGFRCGGGSHLVVGVPSLERGHGVLAGRALEHRAQILREHLVVGFSQFPDHAQQASSRSSSRSPMTLIPSVGATSPSAAPVVARNYATVESAVPQGRNAGDDDEVDSAREDRHRKRTAGAASFPDLVMCQIGCALPDH